MPLEASSWRVRVRPSDTVSNGDDEIDEYDFWEEQFWLMQQEDDDWRTLQGLSHHQRSNKFRRFIMKKDLNTCE